MTRTILATLMMVLAASTMASAGVVNYYDFEAGDTADTAADYVGSASTGVTAITFTGSPGAVYQVDATRGNIMNLRRGTQLNFTANDADIALGANFTVEMWVKSDTWAATTTQDFINANNYAVNLSNNHNWGSGTIGVNVNGSAAASTPRFASGWLHLALVGNTAAGTFNLYINPGVAGERIIGGVLAAGAGTTTSLRFSNASQDLQYGPSTQLYLDDLTMYNEALSYDTLVANSLRGDPGLTPLPVPEPITLSLVSLAGLGMLLRRRQKKA